MTLSEANSSSLMDNAVLSACGERMWNLSLCLLRVTREDLRVSIICTHILISNKEFLVEENTPEYGLKCIGTLPLSQVFFINILGFKFNSVQSLSHV